MTTLTMRSGVTALARGAPRFVRSAQKVVPGPTRFEQSCAVTAQPQRDYSEGEQAQAYREARQCSDVCPVGSEPAAAVEASRAAPVSPRPTQYPALPELVRADQ